MTFPAKEEQKSRPLGSFAGSKARRQLFALHPGPYSRNGAAVIVDVRKVVWFRDLVDVVVEDSSDTELDVLVKIGVLVVEDSVVVVLGKRVKDVEVVTLLIPSDPPSVVALLEDVDNEELADEEFVGIEVVVALKKPVVKLVTFEVGVAEKELVERLDDRLELRLVDRLEERLLNMLLEMLEKQLAGQGDDVGSAIEEVEVVVVIVGAVVDCGCLEAL